MSSLYSCLAGADKWTKTHFDETLMELSNRVMDTELDWVKLSSVLTQCLYGRSNRIVYHFFARNKWHGSSKLHEALCPHA